MNIKLTYALQIATAILAVVALGFLAYSISTHDYTYAVVDFIGVVVNIGVFFSQIKIRKNLRMIEAWRVRYEANHMQ